MTDQTDLKPVHRALLSVSDKRGIEALGRALADAGVVILSTGGTFRALEAAGIPVTEVSAHTGFPELMDGRVKTLHPKIHGGILGRRGTDDAAMAEHGIDPIDLVVVNLYPFESTIATPGCTRTEAIEHIDIGGPAMVRAAAKNHGDVAVVVDPDDYAVLIEACASGGLSRGARERLAAKAYRHTAAYDAAVAAYLDEEPFPAQLSIAFQRQEVLRYGENPHQAGAFYVERDAPAGTVAAARQLHGKALSYNNVADTDAALSCAMAFDAPTCVIVKHANPCGVASAPTLLEAYERAFATDPTSAFGGVIAFNAPLDAATAERVIDAQFVEVLVAPSVDDGALAAVQRKKNVRLLACGDAADLAQSPRDYKRVAGGLLVQDADRLELSADGLSVVSQRQPSAAELDDLRFAWRVAWFVKSNAIVYARDRCTIGVGAGQMSRVVSARIAALKAADEGLDVAGSAMASDAFFPFRDGIDAAAEAGVRAVIQPGGSVRDEEVIAAADEHGMAMVFTGVRHFRH